MEPHPKRRGLLAYLVGAGIVGSLLVGPYLGREVTTEFVPEMRPVADHFPFFALPIAWGAWNWWYVRRQPRVAIGVWGVILGVLLVAGVNLMLVGLGRWFPGALLLFVAIPAGYYLLWTFVVGPIDDLIGL